MSNKGMKVRRFTRMQFAEMAAYLGRCPQIASWPKWRTLNHFSEKHPDMCEHTIARLVKDLQEVTGGKAFDPANKTPSPAQAEAARKNGENGGKALKRYRNGRQGEILNRLAAAEESIKRIYGDLLAAERRIQALEILGDRTAATKPHPILGVQAEAPRPNPDACF